MKPKPIVYVLLGSAISILLYSLFLKPADTATASNKVDAATQTSEGSAISTEKSAVCLQKCATNGVPTSICMTVFAQFPDVSCEQLAIENQAYGHEVLFSINSQAIEMEFDKVGNLIETEYDNYPERKVPSAVVEAFRREFKGKEVKEYEKEIYLDGTCAYEIEILGSKDVDITYNEKGIRIKNTNED